MKLIVLSPELSTIVAAIRTVAEIQATPGTIQICTEVIQNQWVAIRIMDNSPGTSSGQEA